MKELKELLLKNSYLKFVGLSFNTDVVEKEIYGDTFYIIGNDNEGILGIKSSDMAIYSIYDEDEPCFVNSSLQQLIKCILLVKETIDWDDDFDEKIRKKEVRTAIKEIKKIDKSALADEDNWWSLILEQAEDGLL